jgi:uncharacterized protein
MIPINVAQLLKEPVGSERLYQIDEIVESTGTKIVGNVRLQRTNRSIFVTGELKTLYRLSCSRCLKEFDYKVNVNFTDEYYPVVDISTGVALSVPDGSFAITEKHEINLDDAVQQYILLDLPMKPLCKTECKGICPYCGINRNRKSCKCEPLQDPRWSKLRELSSVMTKAKKRKEY